MKLAISLNHDIHIFDTNNNRLFIIIHKAKHTMISIRSAWQRPMLSVRSPLLRRISRRTLVAAPTPNSGPLMERRPDRELPSLPSRTAWTRSLPIFLVAMVACSLAIFNYQKSNSSVVASTLFALRKHPQARAILGDEIYFAHQIPWIWGTISQLQGHIDIAFRVKGTRGKAMMKFKSERKSKMGFFKTTEWSLQPDDGDSVSLLGQDVVDPLVEA